jgi:hypothetical protein
MKASDIEVAPNTPRQLPPKRKSSQLIPKRTFEGVDVRTVDPGKGPRKVINNTSKGTSIFSTILLSHMINIPPEAK